jgi:hypothetical protein
MLKLREAALLALPGWILRVVVSSSFGRGGMTMNPEVDALGAQMPVLL